jgi:hypothetical protein
MSGMESDGLLTQELRRKWRFNIPKIINPLAAPR